MACLAEVGGAAGMGVSGPEAGDQRAKSIRFKTAGVWAGSENRTRNRTACPNVGSTSVSVSTEPELSR
jgi:hypothetical protein